MLSRRIATRLCSRHALRYDTSQHRSITTDCIHPSFTARTRLHVPARAHPVKVKTRWISAPSSSEGRSYDFQQVKDIIADPDRKQLIIDVREPSEYAAGKIPTALSMPITSQPDALFLDPDDFLDRFGFEKPDVDREIVFYCKAGVRSAAAVKLARQNGYGNVGDYGGSWLDWERKGGERG